MKPHLRTENTQASLTVVILAYNEALHIERALKSVAGLAHRVVVVDSGSSDGTDLIAKELGADVYTRDWVNYADQFQWALDHTNISTQWTMRMDADEWFGEDLLESLRELLLNPPEQMTTVSMDRRHHFMGRWIKHGGRFPLTLLRVWKTGLGRIEQRWMDEHIVVESGVNVHLDGEFVDENLNDLSFFTAKHNGYATREAIDVLIDKYEFFRPLENKGLASTRQAKIRRRVKMGIYSRLPLGVGPLMYFIFRYFFQLGFLDGRAGLIYHSLQGCWYRFLVDAKRYEFEKVMKDCTSMEQRIDKLSEISGHDLRAFDSAARGGR